MMRVRHACKGQRDICSSTGNKGMPGGEQEEGPTRMAGQNEEGWQMVRIEMWARLVNNGKKFGSLSKFWKTIAEISTGI